MNELFSLNGKIAVVTGGYGHLGAAMVTTLESFGATVVVGGRSREKFDNKFSKSPGKKIVFKAYDILDSQSIAKALQEVHEEFGGIDILINNAASARGNSPEKMEDGDWSYSVEAVLGSVQKSIREVMPYMKRQGSGKIINVSSMYGVVSPDFRLYEGEECEKYFNPSHYGAAKAAVLQLTRYYAVYLGKCGVNVNAITPGPFPNPEIQKDNPKFIERLKAKNPLGKIGMPSDLAGVCVLLSSDASRFITGQNFIVDGGWTSY